MLKYLYWAVAAIIALGVSFAWGRYSAPLKEKTVEIEKHSVEYKTRIVTKPDGTIIREEVKKDVAEKKEIKSIENKKPDYKITIIPKCSFDTKECGFGGSMEKRMGGPVFAGVYLDKYSAGLSLSVEF